MNEMQFSLLISNDKSMKIIYVKKKRIMPIVIFMKIKGSTGICCCETFAFKYTFVYTPPTPSCKLFWSAKFYSLCVLVEYISYMFHAKHIILKIF